MDGINVGLRALRLDGEMKPYIVRKGNGMTPHICPASDFESLLAKAKTRLGLAAKDRVRVTTFHEGADITKQTFPALRQFSDFMLLPISQTWKKPASVKVRGELAKFHASPGVKLILLSGDRKQRHHYAPADFQDLKHEARLFVNAGDAADIRIVLDIGGARVTDEECLQVLPDKCTLVVLGENEEWAPEFPDSVVDQETVLSEAGMMCKSCKYVEMLTDPSDVLGSKEYLLWYKYLPQTVKALTKEQLMEQHFQGRLKKYHADAAAAVRDAIGPDLYDKHLKTFFDSLVRALEACLLFRTGLSRAPSRTGRLCNTSGLIFCEGPHGSKACPFLHCINPYASLETRLGLKAWQLDHQIEQRTIRAKLVNAAREFLTLIGKTTRKAEHDRLGLLDFMTLWHTRLYDKSNLRYVHISCHITKHRDEEPEQGVGDAKVRKPSVELN